MQRPVRSAVSYTEYSYEADGSMHLFLHGKLYPQSLGVWLCPHKPSIDESDLLQSFELPQADSEQFSALELCNEPSLGWRQPSRAIPAERDGALLGNRLCDVDAVSQAVYTAVRAVGGDGGPAVCAEDVGLLLLCPRRCRVCDALHCAVCRVPGLVTCMLL